MQNRIRKTLASHVWLVADEQGFISGYAYSSRFRTREAYAWTVEVTVYVSSGWQRRGLGSTLYNSLLATLRLQGFCTAVAIIALPNEPSVRLHEKFGFELAGVIYKAGYKLGKWHDVGAWQLELQPHPNAPSPTRALSDLIAESLLPYPQ